MYTNSLTIEQINNLLTGKSKWVVLQFDGAIKTSIGRNAVAVVCKCECGTIKRTNLSEIKNLRSKSCGCSRADKFTRRKYSVVNHDIYIAYKTMINRCYNEKTKIYKTYGAKGVRVCDEWRNNYESFLHWALNNGWVKGLQLDKDIRGDGKHYSSATCSWVTALENMSNRSVSVKYEYNGQYLTLSQICKPLKLNRRTVYGRIKKGKTLQEALCQNY
jgi:hypothetical protein